MATSLRGWRPGALMVALVLVVIAGSPIGGQEAEDRSVYQMGTFKAGSTVYLFGDQVNVRARPDAKAPVVAMLPVGAALTIVGEPAGTYRANGFVSGWYQVKGGSPEKPVAGYVWGGLLALGSLEWVDGARRLRVVAGITKGEKGQFPGEVRILEQGAIKGRVPFTWINTSMGDDAAYSYRVGIEDVPWQGTPRFSHVFQIECNYDACGYTRGKILFFWDGTSGYKGPSAEGVSEAGVFSVVSEFVLPPAEGRQPDEIMVRTVFEEDGDQGAGTPASAKKREIVYRWNGKVWAEKSNLESPLPPPRRQPTD